MTLRKEVKVNILDNINKEKIETFLSKVGSNSVFQSLFIYEMLEDVDKLKPMFYIMEDGDEILGLLLTIIQKEHKNVLGFFSARSVIIGGPIVLNNDFEILSILLKTYNAKIKNKVIYSQFRNSRDYLSDEKKLFEKYGYIYEAHLNIIHDLTLPVEEQWMNLHKGRRKNIRRAEKSGLIFREIENDIEFIKSYNLVKETYKRVKLPIPYNSFFSKRYSVLSRNNILKVFIAELDNEIIGTRMVLCYNSLIYDWIAGASELHLNKYPNDFLPWKVMEWGSKNKYKYFDFGGAGKPNIPYGVRDHKLKFGGELVEHGRFEKIHNKFLFQIGKVGLRMYKKFI